MTKNYYRSYLFVSIRSARIAFLLLILSFIVWPAAAGSRAVNIAEMTSRAARIVHGQVIEVRDGTHPNNERLAVTFITVQVTEMLKGAAVREVTFMQYGNSTHQYVAHLPKYSVGEEVLLFLYPESSLGFTSPIGEGQGKFVVRDDVQSGKRVLINEQLNSSLFARLDAAKMNSKLALNRAEREFLSQSAQSNSRGLEFNTFRSIVRKLTANPNVNLQ